MDDTPIFKCWVCHEVIANPTWDLSRNVQKFGTDIWEGKARETINTLLSQQMFVYDSQECWHLHEPAVASELKLKTTHPSSSPFTPCCRCGTAVDRSLPHISYAITAMNLQEAPDGWLGEVIDSKEFAVLCRDCEEPDEPAAEAVAEYENQTERTSA